MNMIWHYCNGNHSDTVTRSNDAEKCKEYKVITDGVKNNKTVFGLLVAMVNSTFYADSIMT